MGLNMLLGDRQLFLLYLYLTPVPEHNPHISLAVYDYVINKRSLLTFVKLRYYPGMLFTVTAKDKTRF